jgi:hypothetical protein
MPGTRAGRDSDFGPAIRMKTSSDGNRRRGVTVVQGVVPRSKLCLAAVATVFFLSPATRAVPQEGPAPAPLPDLRTFLGEVRDRLHTDDFLLDQYTFNEKQTERQLDSSGNIEKTTTSLYEVYPSPEPGHTYRKLVERDGKRLTPEELAKEDEKQEAREARKAAKLYGEDASKRASAESERRLKETRTIEEIFRIFEFRVAGREEMDGRSTIVLTFEPRSDAEASTRGAKILKKFSGRAWVDEADKQLVRVEAELIDDLSFGFGVLAKLKKGAHALMQRRKINDEIWLPAQARFVGNGRLFLVKSLHVDTVSEYSDYRKFSVATDASVKPDQSN